MKDVKIEKGYAYILSLYRQEIIPKIQEGIMGLIRINSEYENLITPMSKEEYKGLKESIKEEGIRTELHILPNGDILCGNNRYRISQELDIDEKDIPHKIVKIKGDTKIKQYIIEDNLLRRQLSREQKAILEYQLYKLIKRPIQKDSKGKFLPTGDVYQKIADGTGQSRKTIVNHVKYAKFMEEHPTRKEKRLSRVLNHIEVEENKKKEIEKAKNFKSDGTIQIHHGDFEDICNKNVEDNSIDLILTDPPYFLEYMPQWGKLSKVASRVLKEGGFCIAYGYQPYLAQMIEEMSKHLTYCWTINLRIDSNLGQVKKYHPYNILLKWKPILVFYKEPFKKPDVMIEDTIDGSERDKGLHEWQQSEDPFRYLLKCFSKVGDLILEPFAGSGTTLKVCKEMKRKCIGAEIKEEYVEVIKGRLNE